MDAAARDPLVDLATQIHRDRRWIWASTVAAACVHAGLAAMVAHLRIAAPPRRDDAPTQVFDVELATPTPPAARTPPAPEIARPRHSRAPREVAPGHPTPAEAAAILSRRPQIDEPVDLTGDGFVVGSASSSPGGQVSAAGTRTRASSGGAEPSLPSPARMSEPDQSRRASVMGGGEWRCPFPAEADTDQIDQAIVTIRVELDSGGTVTHVELLDDPGHGFGREAQRCAMGRRWNPALDRAGHPIEGTVTLRVRFDR